MTPLSQLFGRFLGGRRALELKKSAVSKIKNQAFETAWVGLGAPNWTNRTYDQLSREGYRKNVIANRCVRIVAESAASVPIMLYRGDQQLKSHALLDVLNAPNPLMSGKELFETFFAFMQISGNAYLEAVDAVMGGVQELYTLRPDRMTVVPGHNGWPVRYDYKVGGQSHGFMVDDKTGNLGKLCYR